MNKLILTIIIITSISSCSSQNLTKKMEQGSFAHVVYFWLNNPENQKERAEFEKSLTTFINNSEFIQTKHLGTPAATDRGVIDNSYTYCLMLTFENKEMQDKYQVEEGHLKFIEESSKLWEKVVVYDSENILK
ncbi:MAG: stress responsive protein [Bacteroidetes bacterium MedPE-SWsnd-G1]|nr:MAG: stress responsive protein [Bacteroidetes bacterium MedPE-SWsnd-G1]